MYIARYIERHSGFVSRAFLFRSEGTKGGGKRRQLVLFLDGGERGRQGGGVAVVVVCIVVQNKKIKSNQIISSQSSSFLLLIIILISLTMTSPTSASIHDDLKYLSRTNLANFAHAAPRPPSASESPITLAPSTSSTRMSSFCSTAGSPVLNLAPWARAAT